MSVVDSLSQALSWWGRTDKTYLAADREDDWRTYCEELVGKRAQVVRSCRVVGVEELLKGK